MGFARAAGLDAHAQPHRGHVQLLEGPLADAVNAVKAQDGPEIHVQGSADLIQSLHADGLIDEFNVWTFRSCSARDTITIRRSLTEAGWSL
jgi:dihydrofolate reductase